MRRGGSIVLACVLFAVAGCGAGSQSGNPVQNEMRAQRIHAEGTYDRQRLSVALIDAGQGRINKAKLDLVEACPNVLGSELAPLVESLRRLSRSNPPMKTLEAELAAVCPP